MNNNQNMLKKYIRKTIQVILESSIHNNKEFMMI